MEGFDLRRHRIKRFLLKRSMLRVALTRGIPRNYTVDANLTPPLEVDLDESVDALERSIARYVNQDGTLHGHPLFGVMPRSLWDQVHRVHCAHHLSFVHPT